MDSRIQQLRTTLIKEQLDAIFVSSLPNILYLADVAGQLQDHGDAFLLITQKKQYFFTYRMYSEAVRKHLENFTLVEIVRNAPLATSLQKIALKEKLRHIGYETNSLTVAEFTTFSHDLPENTFVPSTGISLLRLIKTPDEIARIQAACTLGDAIFHEVLSKITVGITEKQVASEIDYAIGRENASTCFTTVTAFGKNAAYPHHVASSQKIKKGDVMLIDFGVKKNSYCSDMSRTIFWGKASLKNKKVYQAVYDAQQRSIEYILKQLSTHETINPGIVDQVARDYITKQGLPPFQHASHGIGLDYHELPYFSPLSKVFLGENMTFSIEPGCYLPGELGVRIEDLFAIQNNKLVQLTHAPKELIEL
jgi:Xaa-Pro aminopeptidase